MQASVTVEAPMQLVVANRLSLMPRIVAIAAAVCGLPLDEVRGKSRVKTVVYCRQLATWAGVRIGGMSMSLAGRRMGNRDHTTAMHSCRKIDAMLAAGDERTIDAIDKIKSVLTGQSPLPKVVYVTQADLVEIKVAKVADKAVQQARKEQDKIRYGIDPDDAVRSATDELVRRLARYHPKLRVTHVRV